MRIKSVNPATQAIVWEGNAATPAEIDRAIAAAHASDWPLRSLEERITVLEAFGKELSRSNLAETISMEMGKPLWESRAEVKSMVGKIGLSIEAYKIRCKLLQPTVGTLSRPKPHGVVAVLGPFNFPGHLPNGHIVPALLAGNTVIFKPSELTPRVAEETVACWRQAGLPEEALQLIQGGAETGAILSAHPGLDGLFFTGSYATGIKLSQQSPPGKILALELGGNNPLVIGSTTDLEAAALITIQSAFLTSGQRCSCARRLIVVQNEPFIQELLRQIDAIRIGPYTHQPEPFMGTLVTLSAAQKMMEAQTRLERMGESRCYECCSMRRL